MEVAAENFIAQVAGGKIHGHWKMFYTYEYGYLWVDDSVGVWNSVLLPAAGWFDFLQLNLASSLRSRSIRLKESKEIIRSYQNTRTYSTVYMFMYNLKL